MDTVKLWLLRAREGHKSWEPWYDKSFGHVVRAESETEARAAVEGHGGDEIRTRRDEEYNPWLDPEASTCKPLEHDGPAEVILTDFHSA